MPSTFELVEDPIDVGERTAVAGKCMDDLDLPMPALIDGLDDKVGRAYGGWPDRLYVIGIDGKVEYAGARGPAGFDTAAWEKAIAAAKAKVPPKNPEPKKEPKKL